MARKLRAIVFDDNDDDRYLVKRLLERRGYEVLCYADPSECPLLHSHECQCEQTEACCDILITDLNMLRVSGLEFLEQQIQKGCKIPNIAIASGDWSDSNLKHAQRLGCTTIEKTPKLDALADWLHERGLQIDPSRLLSSWFLQQDNNDSSPAEQDEGDGK
ncbi:MAG: response regulator [Deltaproteobacteria bacterium]|nr:response regulator [Deltaproteobacteria bacterium]